MKRGNRIQLAQWLLGPLLSSSLPPSLSFRVTTCPLFPGHALHFKADQEFLHQETLPTSLAWVFVLCSFIQWLAQKEDKTPPPKKSILQVVLASIVERPTFVLNWANLKPKWPMTSIGFRALAGPTPAQ